MKLHHVIHGLHNWLAEHHLPIKGVRIIIEFPVHEDAFRASDSLKTEYHPSTHSDPDFAAYAQGSAGAVLGTSVTFKKVQE